MNDSRRCALVTGAGRNIGKAVALDLARQGLNVVVNARANREEAESVAAEARALGVEALPILADVADRTAVEGMFQQALERFGRIDILVNNAAIRKQTPFTELSPENWDQILGVCLDGACYCARLVVPGMIERRWGRIVNMIGALAEHGAADRAHVSAAKNGLIGLTRSLAMELGIHGITVNAVSPGAIDTVRPTGVALPNLAHEVELSAMKRMGRPEEISAVCAFLASDGASYVTGQVIGVNGGLGL